MAETSTPVPTITAIVGAVVEIPGQTGLWRICRIDGDRVVFERWGR